MLRDSDEGFHHRLRFGGKEVGYFTAEVEENPELDQTVASKLGVELKEILAARLYEVLRPTTFEGAEVRGRRFDMIAK